jgi:hypothetical protein
VLLNIDIIMVAITATTEDVQRRRSRQNFSSGRPFTISGLRHRRCDHLRGNSRGKNQYCSTFHDNPPLFNTNHWCRILV